MPNSATQIFDKLKIAAGFVDDGAIEVVKKWNSLSSLYSEPVSKINENMAFYKGEQWSDPNKDRIQRVYNYAASLVRKFQGYEGASLFDVNVKADDDQLSQITAEAAESLIYKIMESARFWLMYVESRLMKSLYGSIYWLPVWQPDNKTGSKKGTIEIKAFSGDKVRVGYTDSTFTEAEYYVAIKRVRIDSARRMYKPLLEEKGLTEADLKPDRDIVDTDYVSAVTDYLQKGTNVLYSLQDDDHVTVFNYRDHENYKLVVGQHTLIDRPHNYKINGAGFCPITHEPNITVPGEHFGLSDLEFVMDMLIALNKLYSLLEEIIEDNAYPMMFEINNALRGKKLRRGEMRGKVTQMTIEPGEEGVRILQGPTIVQPVLAAIAEVKAAIFDVASMPAAAFGAYQPNTKSGFQATVQMQPALQEIDLRHVRTTDAMKQLFRMCLAILETEDKASVTVTLPEEKDPIDGSVIFPEQKVTLENLAGHDMDIIFGNPLPKDDARVVQNETAKEKNGYQSRRTTMQTLGVENPSKEQAQIDKEQEDLAKVQAKVQSIIAEAQLSIQQKAAEQQAQAQAAAQQQTQGGLQPGANGDQGASGVIKPGQNPAQAFPNTEGGATVPSTAQEAVADTSVL